jgi:hypothetical protein
MVYHLKARNPTAARVADSNFQGSVPILRAIRAPVQDPEIETQQFSAAGNVSQV